MGAVVVHAVVGGHQHLIAGVEPALQVVGQEDVGRACAVAVLRAVEAVLVAGVVDVHRVDDQQVRRVSAAQAFGVGEQVRIRVVVLPVEVPVLDRQGLVVGMPVTGGDKGRAVIQLADPVISRRGGGETGVAGIMEQAALVGQARHMVVGDAAVDRRHAGEDAFVERPGERRQFTFEFVEGCASCADVGLQMPHGMTGNLEVQAVEHHKDDVVLHRGRRSATDGFGSGLRLESEQMWEQASLLPH